MSPSSTYLSRDYHGEKVELLARPGEPLPKGYLEVVTLEFFDGGMCYKDFVTFPFIVCRESQLMWRRWTSPWLALKFIWKMSPTGKEERANRKILDDFTNQVDFLKKLMLS